MSAFGLLPQVCQATVLIMGVIKKVNAKLQLEPPKGQDGSSRRAHDQQRRHMTASWADRVAFLCQWRICSCFSASVLFCSRSKHEEDRRYVSAVVWIPQTLLLTKQDYSVGLSSLLFTSSLPFPHFAPSVLLWRQLCIYTCDIPASS